MAKYWVYLYDSEMSHPQSLYVVVMTMKMITEIETGRGNPGGGKKMAMTKVTKTATTKAMSVIKLGM